MVRISKEKYFINLNNILKVEQILRINYYYSEMI